MNSSIQTHISIRDVAGEGLDEIVKNGEIINKNGVNTIMLNKNYQELLKVFLQ